MKKNKKYTRKEMHKIAANSIAYMFQDFLDSLSDGAIFSIKSFESDICKSLNAFEEEFEESQKNGVHPYNG